MGKKNEFGEFGIELDESPEGTIGLGNGLSMDLDGDLNLNLGVPGLNLDLTGD